MSLISSFKGWFGEAQTMLVHFLKLDSSIYKQFNNVTISGDRGTTQIDHIIVSRYGIFVIETKNMGGWIYGGERQAQWTQVFHAKKYKFQNPLHQNYRHTKALATFLHIDHEKLHSIVFFWGDCTFKTDMPENVLQTGYSHYIKSQTKVLFSEAEVAMIGEAIATGRLPKGWKTHSQHVQSLRDRHNNTTICPTCGGELKLRTAKRGQNAGNQFYGCSNYPKCRYVRDKE
ncbi:MAG: NERD domain-containing protein [Cyanobacteria bacterium J06638_22]